MHRLGVELELTIGKIYGLPVIPDFPLFAAIQDKTAHTYLFYLDQNSSAAIRPYIQHIPAQGNEPSLLRVSGAWHSDTVDDALSTCSSLIRRDVLFPGIHFSLIGSGGGDASWDLTDVRLESFSCSATGRGSLSLPVITVVYSYDTLSGGPSDPDREEVDIEETGECPTEAPTPESAP